MCKQAMHTPKHGTFANKKKNGTCCILNKYSSHSEHTHALKTPYNKFYSPNGIGKGRQAALLLIMIAVEQWKRNESRSNPNTFGAHYIWSIGCCILFIFLNNSYRIKMRHNGVCADCFIRNTHRRNLIHHQVKFTLNRKMIEILHFVQINVAFKSVFFVVSCCSDAAIQFKWYACHTLTKTKEENTAKKVSNIEGLHPTDNKRYCSIGRRLRIDEHGNELVYLPLAISTRALLLQTITARWRRNSYRSHDIRAMQCAFQIQMGCECFTG